MERISPILAVANIDETIKFYEEVLGFTRTMSFPEYAIIEREGQTIHLQPDASEEVMNAVRGHTQIYIEVSDIWALWERVKTFKGRYQIRDLFDRDYGMTEFHLGDPNGCLIFVGQRTSK